MLTFHVKNILKEDPCHFIPLIFFISEKQQVQMQILKKEKKKWKNKREWTDPDQTTSR